MEHSKRELLRSELGIVLDPSDNTITAVTPLGPADVAGLMAGEKLISVSGATLSATINLDELLQHPLGSALF